MPELVTIGAAPPAKRARWRNPYRALPAVRWGVQGLYLAFLLLVGFEFWRFQFVQQEVGKLAQTAIEFPPMQPGASFNLEAVKAQIEKARAAHGQ
mgnify:CR=1 FL=1